MGKVDRTLRDVLSELTDVTRKLEDYINDVTVAVGECGPFVRKPTIYNIHDILNDTLISSSAKIKVYTPAILPFGLSIIHYVYFHQEDDIESVVENLTDVFYRISHSVHPYDTMQRVLFDTEINHRKSDDCITVSIHNNPAYNDYDSITLSRGKCMIIASKYETFPVGVYPMNSMIWFVTTDISDLKNVKKSLIDGGFSDAKDQQK